MTRKLTIFFNSNIDRHLIPFGKEEILYYLDNLQFESRINIHPDIGEIFEEGFYDCL